MNYRLMGLIAMMGAPFIFLKMALGGFASNPVHPLITICDLIFYIALFSSIIGLFRLSISAIDIVPKIILFIGIFLLSASCCSVIPQAANYTRLTNFLQACRSASTILIIIIASSIVLSGKTETWKKYLWLISPAWLLSSFIAWYLFPANEIFLVCSLAYSGIISSLLGYHIYNSDDPEIVKENMLYEVSTL
jgi:hypothetical protein